MNEKNEEKYKLDCLAVEENSMKKLQSLGITFVFL